MSTSSGSAETVLVVDDDIELADTFALWLSEEYEVLTAQTGDDAIANVDVEPALVILDRRLPDLSPTTFLDEVQSTSPDTRSMMVSAVPPDPPILEWEIDAYVPKPVDKAGLRTAVRQVLSLREQSPDVQRYCQLRAKLLALDAYTNEQTLRENDQYTDALTEIERLESTFSGPLPKVADQDYVATFRKLAESD